MKTRTYLTALMLLLVPLCFSSGTYAQTKAPETDLQVVFSGTKLTGEWVNVNGEVTNLSANSYSCVFIYFSLYGRPADVRNSGPHLGDIAVEVRDVEPRVARRFTKYLPNPAWTVRKKSVTECSAPQESLEVILFENPNFGGRSKPFGVGNHQLLPASGFNDVASSIKVPSSLVVIVFEHSAEGVGYGLWVDFLEDQPNLDHFNFDNKISHLKIVSRRDSNSVWVRNSLQNGVFAGGHYQVISRGGGSPPANPNPLIGPPKPAPRRPEPTPGFCTISGQVRDDKPGYGTRITLYRNGSPTSFSVTVNGKLYSISNVLEGTYEVRGSGNYPRGTMPSGQPTGLGIFLDDSSDSSKVTCTRGQESKVNFKIGSIEG